MCIENYDIFRVVKECVARENLFNKRSKIIAAVSGGIDSMTLIEILIALKKEFDLTLAIAHVNYGLRSTESDGDEHLVRSFAEKKGLPVYVKKIDADDPVENKTGSFQERARNIRYSFFEELRLTYGFDLIATGHTSDDNAETVFLNFLRGSGPEGLGGIPPKRESIIRPLIDIPRKKIENFARTEGIPFRVDSSNISDRYARNIVRNEVFPLIQSKIRENIGISINRTSEIVRAIDGFIRDEAHKQSAGMVKKTGDREYFIEKQALKSLHPVLANYVIRNTAGSITGHPVSFEITQRIQRLLDSSAGASVLMTPDYRVDSESSGIRFLENKDPEKYITTIELNEEYSFKHFIFRCSVVSREQVSFDKNMNIEYIDAGKITKPLILRCWQEGDRMQPLGMQTLKKVSDIFIDAKVPQSYKHRVPLLTTLDAIVWVCGVQLDDRYKVTEKTQRILRIEYIPHAKR